MSPLPDASQGRPLSQETYYTIACVYAVLAVSGFTLNGLVMFAFAMDRSLWLPTNLLVLSISVGDWLMAVAVNPLGVAANISEAWSLGTKSCAFYAFSTTALGFGAMMHHTAIAVERVLCINRPFMTSISNGRMGRVISALWIFALLWALFPLVGWSAYVPEGGNTACSLKWRAPGVKDVSYIHAVFVLFFFAPITLIVFSYVSLYRSVKWMSHNAVRLWGAKADSTLEIMSAQTKTAKVSCVMVCCFVVGWTPYALLSLYVAIGKAAAFPPLFTIIPSILAKTTTVWNPIICFFMYGRFKRSLKRSWRRFLCRNTVVGDASPKEGKKT